MLQGTVLHSEKQFDHKHSGRIDRMVMTRQKVIPTKHGEQEFNGLTRSSDAESGYMVRTAGNHMNVRHLADVT